MSLPAEPPPVDPDATATPVTSTPATTAPVTSMPAMSDPATVAPTVAAAPDLRPRPLIERIGMAAIALVVATMFVLVSAAAFIGGEPFLGIMGAAGVLMVLWVGGLTLIRG